MRTWIYFCSIVFLVACQSLTPEDVPATLSAERIAYATQSIAIERTALIERAGARVTVQAAETQAAELNALNRVLLATVRAGETPVPPIVPGVMDEFSVMVQDDDEMETAGGQVAPEVAGQFSQLAVATGVRSSDGCATGIQSSFSADVGRIYFTMVASPLRRGTQFVVEWQYEQALVDRSTWTPSEDASRLCVWFYTDGPFTPGNWTASLFVDGQLVSPIVPFTVEGG